ncbi:MAG TPA: amidohydrolase family protein [Candidatus Acidoferrales bacterium]|nr:amidohydrolase family protein [Candidatus Acidoferrales bacterium]
MSSLTNATFTAAVFLLISSAISPQTASLPPDIPANATRYTFLLAGQKAGAFAAWTAPGNVRNTFYSYNDRGRGPELRASLTLGANGAPVSVHVTGHDYLKAEVTEDFSIKDGVAKWKNNSEQGEGRSAHPAFYLRLSEAPDDPALLVKALLASGGKLALLPEGEARLEHVGEGNVKAEGKTLRVTQYAISGLGFSPEYVWLDRQRNLFAAGTNWSAVIREGWEANWSALLDIQEQAASAHFQELARTLRHKPSAPVMFQHAGLFDSETATVRPGMTVMVNDNRIQAVGPDGTIPVPRSAEIIDAKGKTLLPGLWDMHVHVGGEVDGLEHLAAGVTTIRDMANDNTKLQRIRGDFDSGAAIGPRILMAGVIESHSPYQGPTNVLVETPQEARDAVDRYKNWGYEQIKIYSSVRPELVPVIAAEAHKYNLRVSGHIPQGLAAEQAIRDGYDEIQHANFIFLNFLTDRVKDTRTPERFTAVAKYATEFPPDSPQMRGFLKLLLEHHTALDPTMNVFEAMFTAWPNAINPVYAAVADRLPPQVRRGLMGGGLPIPPGEEQHYRDSFQTILDVIGAFYKAGVPIEAGTDAMPGFTLDRELELDAAAGIPAPQVLQLATLGAARIMRHDTVMGSIAPGKLADLILVEGNPAVKISDIRRVVLVMKNGDIYDPARLDRAIGIKPLQ